MPQYTVANKGGGFTTVNASDPVAARENAGADSDATVIAGGNAAHQENGTAVGGYAPGYGPSGAGGGGGGGGVTGASASAGSVTDLDRAIEEMWKAARELNVRDFGEKVREFDATLGFNKDVFNEHIRQFNQNYLISQAGLTGTFNGQPTLPAQMGYAEMFGQWGVPTAGQQTLAANQQQYAQQLGAIQTASQLQTNPFRQAEVLGQLGPLLAGRGVAGFQAPGQATGQTDFSGMGNMQRLIDDIRGGPGAVNSQSVQQYLNAIPTPNKVNSTEFFRSSPMTQNLLLSGMQQKYGLDPNEAMNQIRNTLPAFTAPSTFGQIRG